MQLIPAFYIQAGAALGEINISLTHIPNTEKIKLVVLRARNLTHVDYDSGVGKCLLMCLYCIKCFDFEIEKLYMAVPMKQNRLLVLIIAQNVQMCLYRYLYPGAPQFLIPMYQN